MATLTGTDGNDFFDDGTRALPPGYTGNPGTTDGDDFVSVKKGDDIVFAGPGFDTVFLNGALPGYDIFFHADTTIDITARFGTADGDKELHGVEKLAVSTGTATIDVSAPGVARVNTGSGADTVSVFGNLVGGVHNNWVSLDRGLFAGDTNLMTFESFGALNLNTGSGDDSVTMGIVMGLGWTEFTDTSGHPQIARPLTVDLGTGADALDLSNLEFSSFDPATSLFFSLPPDPGRFHLLAGASPIQVSMGQGDDSVLGSRNAPITVADSKIGSEHPGINIVDGGGALGNWLAFSGLGIAAGSQGVTADLTTGVATSSIAGHQTTFSNIQNIAGTRGNDIITADQWANLIDFLNGIDDGVLGGQEAGRHDMVAFSTANGGLAIDLAAGTATGGTSTGLVNATFTGAEGAFGTNFADVIDGTAKNDCVFGLGGNDTADGGAGDSDVYSFTGFLAQYDIVHNPDETFTVTDLRVPDDLPLGMVSDGVDTCRNFESFRFADQLVCADAAGSAVFDVNLADVATGATPEKIVGGAGDNDTAKITAEGDGEIEITPSHGDLLLLFFGILQAAKQYQIRLDETEHVEVSIKNGFVDMRVVGDFTDSDLASNTLALNSGNFDDTMDASGVTSNHRVVMNAGGGADTLKGGAGADILDGGGGIDALNGGTNNDTLRGGAGNDSLSGRGGADTLVGGVGQDQLDGGTGDDAFVFKVLVDSGIGAAARDQISKFAVGDKINVKAIDAIAGGVDDPFVLDAGGKFLAGEIRQVATNDGNLLLKFNVGGDAEPEMSILLRGRTNTLEADDFVL